MTKYQKCRARFRWISFVYGWSTYIWFCSAWGPGQGLV